MAAVEGAESQQLQQSQLPQLQSWRQVSERLADEVLDMPVDAILRFTLALTQGIMLHQAPPLRDASLDFKASIRAAHDATLSLLAARQQTKRRRPPVLVARAAPIASKPSKAAEGAAAQRQQTAKPASKPARK